MKRRITRIALGLIVVNTLSYWLFADSRIEQTVCDKFAEFTELRTLKTWEGVQTEYVSVSSCGDELFRNPETLERTILNGKPLSEKDFQFESSGRIGEDEFRHVVYVIENDIDVLGTIRNYTDTTRSNGCVVFKACVLRSIPMLFKRIEYKYYFTSTPTDFHSLYHNGQSVSKTPYYIWVLGMWLEISSEIQGISGD